MEPGLDWRSQTHMRQARGATPIGTISGAVRAERAWGLGGGRLRGGPLRRLDESQASPAGEAEEDEPDPHAPGSRMV